MKYVYEDLSDTQFEDLVIFLCQRFLGVSVQGFAKGPDGGRDAKFVGTADMFPSVAAPWVGTVVIQAKHTYGTNRSFSDTDFYSEGSKTATLALELPRIHGLKLAKQLDHYMLFSNRRLTGNADSAIKKYLAKHTGIPEASIYLCGLEQLELWLRRFPEVAGDAQIDLVDSPLIVSPDDLAEIIEALAASISSNKIVVDDPPAPRVSYADKNAMNRMSPEYAAAQVSLYLKDTNQIRNFLAAPENSSLLTLYMGVVDEFNFKIISKRKDYQAFDEVIEHLLTVLFGRDALLRKQRRLTRIMLFYMYWNCDIGQETNA